MGRALSVPVTRIIMPYVNAMIINKRTLFLMRSGHAEPIELFSVQPIASPLLPLRTFAPHLRKIDLVLPGVQPVS